KKINIRLAKEKIQAVLKGFFGLFFAITFIETYGNPRTGQKEKTLI
ncbi:TPA: hypothetical protein SUX93_001002, partial [Streptococcus equi subsp. equi]|nr:hypothetical protein [Streptococcus equi subsp. equi]